MADFPLHDHPHDKVWEAEVALAGLIDLLREAGDDAMLDPKRIAVLIDHVRVRLAAARDQLCPPPA